MTIEKTDAWHINFKVKQANVSIGSQIKIDQVVINSPGEYDVLGVAVQGIEGKSQTIYLITSEDLHFCVIPSTPEVLDQGIIEQLGGVDVAVVPVVKNVDVSETIALVNSLDPSVVIPIGDGAMDEFAKLSNEATDNHSNIKLTKSLLPIEGRQTYLISPQH